MIITSPIWTPAVLTTATLAAVAYASSEIYKSYQHMEVRKEKEGKQKDGCPKSNEAQNDQMDGAVQEIEHEIGRKLSKDERQRLHRYVSGRDCSYHEIVEDGVDLFRKY